jgi:hypothetical protein
MHVVGYFDDFSQVIQHFLRRDGKPRKNARPVQAAVELMRLFGFKKRMIRKAIGYAEADDVNFAATRQMAVDLLA